MSKKSPALNPALSARIRAASRTRVGSNKYALYEVRKAEWIASNPDAGCTEYEAAMCRIAKECKV